MMLGFLFAYLDVIKNKICKNLCITDANVKIVDIGNRNPNPKYENVF